MAGRRSGSGGGEEWSPGKDLEIIIASALEDAGWQVDRDPILDRECATDMVVHKGERHLRLQVTRKGLLQCLRPEEGRPRSKAAEFLRKGRDPRLPRTDGSVFIIVHRLDGRESEVLPHLQEILEGKALPRMFPALVYFDPANVRGQLARLDDALGQAGRYT